MLGDETARESRYVPTCPVVERSEEIGAGTAWGLGNHEYHS